MPTVVRLDQKRYLASGVDLKELFDQIPQPIAYFDANNRLGACNLSFRDAFPVVIESECEVRFVVERDHRLPNLIGSRDCHRRPGRA